MKNVFARLFGTFTIDKIQLSSIILSFLSFLPFQFIGNGKALNIAWYLSVLIKPIFLSRESIPWHIYFDDTQQNQELFRLS